MPLAASFLEGSECIDIAECPMDEDEQEEEQRVPSTRLLEEDIEDHSLVNQDLLFTALIAQKHRTYIKSYVPMFFDVPTEPPEFIG